MLVHLFSTTVMMLMILLWCIVKCDWSRNTIYWLSTVGSWAVVVVAPHI